MKPTPPLMQRFAAAFSTRGRTRVYRWLWDHFEQLPPRQRYQVNWQELTDRLNDIPINPVGEPPLTKDVVRKTYLRVAEAKRREGNQVNQSPVPTARPVPSQPSLSTAKDDLRARMRPATPKKD